MKKRLQDHLSSGYIESANKLRSKRLKKRIVAYVESYDDVFFWRSILKKFENDEYYFEVMLPSRTSLSRGKKSALMNMLGPGLGEYMIACVDADYDWLLQGATEMSKTVCSNPYVIHTYAYAIENYQCYAPNLHTICVMSTLNDRIMIDLNAFMSEYSSIIWPLFVWNIWCYRYNNYSEFTMSDFCEVVTFRDVNPYHPENTLQAVKNRVNKKIAWLQRRFPEGKKTYAPLRAELLNMGLTPETTYLFMQGHSVFENVVMPLLTPVCTLLRKEREREIVKLAEHEIQRQNELACYQHSQAPVDDMLRKNTGFRTSKPYEWLSEDIKRLMEEVGRPK
ncbi:MAG: DUF4435 domain-containing protein [Bacteroidaceae bacterium]|nr:DUF4435 domain-containing protein [Bacteroidaceae bacterium]MBR4855340.1 DUF4435 domain-containing protein [Bacteroidaceae bacterium]